MLKIRLKKFGRKRQPFYRIVIIENSVRRNGKPIEEVGFYDPIQDNWKINVPRIVFHLQHGAQPTLTVKNLLIKANIIQKVTLIK